MARVMIQ